MTILYLLDTDHISLFQRYHSSVVSRIASLSPETIAVSIVSATEQTRGRLAQLHRAKTVSEIVNAFDRFQEILHFYRTVPILPYDEAAAEQFVHLRQHHRQRPDTQDLRIAAIALSRGVTVVTRNQRDFSRVIGLQIEDWSEPYPS